MALTFIGIQTTSAQIGGDVRGRRPGCRARFVIRAHVLDPAFTAAGPAVQPDMRSRKYRVVTTLERASNRLIRAALRGLGAPRVRPAGDDRPPDRAGAAYPGGKRARWRYLWLVAAHGTQAGYVRNLQAEPRVRVKAGGLWRAGTAVVLPGDDPAARSRMLPHQLDAAIGTMMASARLTIRIDLDPRPEPT